MKTITAKRNCSEKSIETAILEYLNYVPGCYAWKNQSTGVWDPTRKIFRKARSKYAINGVSDILGVFNGRLLAVECKAPKNKKRPEHQTAFIKKINDLGGIAFYADSVDMVRKELAKV